MAFPLAEWIWSVHTLYMYEFKYILIWMPSYWVRVQTSHHARLTPMCLPLKCSHTWYSCLLKGILAGATKALWVHHCILLSSKCHTKHLLQGLSICLTLLCGVFLVSPSVMHPLQCNWPWWWWESIQPIQLRIIIHRKQADCLGRKVPAALS
jgi:hypothetical protein